MKIDTAFPSFPRRSVFVEYIRRIQRAGFLVHDSSYSNEMYPSLNVTMRGGFCVIFVSDEAEGRDGMVAYSLSHDVIYDGYTSVSEIVSQIYRIKGALGRDKIPISKKYSLSDMTF